MRLLLALLLFVSIVEAKRGAGPYIGGGYGSSLIKDKGYYDLDKKSSNGYIVYAGAYINDNLSVEIEHVGSLKYRQKNQSQISPAFNDINTQAHYPIWNKMIDLYVKFGAGYVEDGKSGHTFVYGGGMAYRIDAKFALKVGYDYFDYGIDLNGDNSADKKVAIEYFFSAFEVQF